MELIGGGYLYENCGGSFYVKDLRENLFCGNLPSVNLMDHSQKEDYLESYVQAYLEEEVRAEALSRNLGALACFLEQAALESGKFQKVFMSIWTTKVTRLI